MKRKMFTASHNIELLKEIDNNAGRFTAQEHAYVTEKEFGESIYKTKESLLRYALASRLQRISSLGIILDAIKVNGYKNVLSLGSGDCVNEYILSMCVPQGCRVIATDFDGFLINKAKEFFPEISTEGFDFSEGKISSLKDKLKLEFDLAVFIGSSYIMDDSEFIRLFSDLKLNGVRQVIDFHAGYMDAKSFIKYSIEPITRNDIIRKLCGKAPVTKENFIGGYLGKFHGYTRSRNEVRNLYRKSGWKILKELPDEKCKYVGVLGS